MTKSRISFVVGAASTPSYDSVLLAFFSLFLRWSTEMILLLLVIIHPSIPPCTHPSCYSIRGRTAKKRSKRVHAFWNGEEEDGKNPRPSSPKYTSHHLKQTCITENLAALFLFCLFLGECHNNRKRRTDNPRKNSRETRSAGII
jgi:hypothetical protein